MKGDFFLFMIKISSQVSFSGLSIIINKKNYPINYPIPIWLSLSNDLKEVFSESVAFALTWQLPITKKDIANYNFAHPIVEPIFFELLIYSIPMSILVNNGRTKTSSLLKSWYNSNFMTTFRSPNRHIENVPVPLNKNASLFFSFGKDSLISYALLREMKIDTNLFFIEEPNSKSENFHKGLLKKRFEKEFHQTINFMKLPVGSLREMSDNYLGWDVILAQYCLLIIPYLFYYRSRYVFFGNELSCTDKTEDDEGYYVNPVFEQSTKGLNLINLLLSLFGLTTATGSLIGGINEIFIIYILFSRYPEIAKFQMSCISESKKNKQNRWCGECEKCARMYIFMTAFGINPSLAGFDENMLSSVKERHFVIFGKIDDSSAYGSSGLGKNEQQLAFYLAYKKGAKGELIDKFVNKYLKEAILKLSSSIKFFFGIHINSTLPDELKMSLDQILKREQKNVFSYIKKLTD